MNLIFEHDFQQKIMTQRFGETLVINSAAQITKWRSLWMQELKSWHSPYKVILDCSNLTFHASTESIEALTRMIKFFEGLFLRSITGFGFNDAQGHGDLPFKVVSTFEEAQRDVGVRGLRDPSAPVDFRGSIQFQNHFAQHVIEMNFTDDVVIDSQAKIDAIKSKLTNNLMQWHSKWSLLIDCSRVKFDPSIHDSWKKLEKYFTSFFMKAVIGYSPDPVSRAEYPFETYRARHAAVAKLENEGLFMGNEAQCRSKS